MTTNDAIIEKCDKSGRFTLETLGGIKNSIFYYEGSSTNMEVCPQIIQSLDWEFFSRMIAKVEMSPQGLPWRLKILHLIFDQENRMEFAGIRGWNVRVVQHLDFRCFLIKFVAKEKN